MSEQSDKPYARIWLQPGQGDERTWCQDKINDEDVEYVRADLARSAAARSEDRIAEDAIDLFLEYRDKHGRDEDAAKAAALNEFAEARSAESATPSIAHEESTPPTHWLQVGWAKLGTVHGQRYIQGLRNLSEGQNDYYREAVYVLETYATESRRA
jgi:hypothetical protein